MECPHCHHVTGTALLKCSECGEVYDRDTLEELQHVEYLLSWLTRQREHLGESVYNRLTGDIQARRTSILSSLLPETPIPSPAAEIGPSGLSQGQIHRIALLAAVQKRIVLWVGDGILGAMNARNLRDLASDEILDIDPDSRHLEITLPGVSEDQITGYVSEQLPGWVSSALLTQTESDLLLDYLGQQQLEAVGDAAGAARPITVPEEGVPAEPAPEARPAAPPPPPEPREPLVRWDKLWSSVVEAAVSGLLLRWLRYLGAFLFVVSLGIVVVNFWNDIPQWGQVLIIFFVPTAFYAGGWLLRTRLGVVQTGGVLMGVGQILLAVDFAAIYQFGGLTIDLSVYWLVTSIICTLIYVLTVWFIVQAEFFGYIGLAGIGSTAAAGMMLATRTVEWPLVAAAGVSVLSVEAGYRMRKAPEKWREIAESARRFPQFTIPMVLLALLLIPGEQVPWAQAVGFSLATLAAGLLAWRFRNVIHTHIAAWGTAFAVILFLRAANVPWEWYPSAGAGLAALYFAVHRFMRRGGEGIREELRPHLLPFYAAGVAVLALSVSAGVFAVPFDYWPGVVGLTASAVVMVLGAGLMAQSLLVAGAAVLFIAPFTLSLFRWLEAVPQRNEWILAAWMALSLIYLGSAVMLRRQSRHVRWLTLTAHLLVPAGLGLLAVEGLVRRSESILPDALLITGALVVYLVSTWMHHGNRHPALSFWVRWLPPRVSEAAFLWPAAALVPVLIAVIWSGTILEPAWLGAALAGLGLVYVGLGPIAGRWKDSYRAPFRILPYLVGLAAVLPALGEPLLLMIVLFLDTAVLASLAWIYRWAPDTAAAGLVFLVPFVIAMDQLRIASHAYGLGFALLAGLAYIPLAEIFRRRVPQEWHHWPMWGIGYLLSLAGIVWSLMGRFGLFELDVPWVGVLVPLLAAILYGWSAYRVHPWFGWAAAAVFPVAFGQALTLLRVREDWLAVTWAGLGAAYLLAAAVPGRIAGSGAASRWTALMRWPLNLGAWILAGLGIALTLPFSAAALGYGLNLTESTQFAGPVAAQWLSVGFIVLAAWLYRSRWPLFLEPWLAVLPFTLMFIGYGEAWFGRRLDSAEFGMVWAGIAALHLVVAAALDRLQPSERHPHGIAAGLYAGGYVLSAAAVLWSLDLSMGPPFLWALGTWVVLAAGSMALIHFRRHLAWAELEGLLFREGSQSLLRSLFNSLFFWLAAWLFPVWLTVFLWELNVVPAFGYLGYAGSAAAFLVLAFLLRRVERSYTWPLMLAGQFYTLLALLNTVPLTTTLLTWKGAAVLKDGGELPVLGYIIVQALTAGYWTASGFFYRAYRRAARIFSYLAGLLTWVPYSLAWIVFRFQGLDFRLGYPWLGLVGVLLGAGFALDAYERRGANERVGMAHGWYFAGYIGLVYAAIWSWPDRLVSLYVVGGAALIALLSHLAVHIHRHDSWMDLVNRFFSSAGRAIYDGVRSAFLWAAAIAYPIWLTSLLAYNDVPWAWRGLALALTAPLYVAGGLFIKRVDKAYAWPLYFTGYLLTALGAMLSFDDPLLAMYVLALNAIVYAASAYIFRQSVWLYLTTVLVPIVAVMAVEVNLDALPAPWVAGIFMGLASLYIVIGRLFDSLKGSEGGLSSFALPFYGPGFLLSALGIAVASVDRELAIVVYLAGVVLYALSAWSFRETIFLYPAVWLTAVPYYLGMTYTQLDPDWYGLGWLPLMAAAFLLGRLVFHRDRAIRSAAHPALPFYILVYALSISMLLMARGDTPALAVALAAAAAVYGISAWVFRRAVWVYPGLLAVHLSLAAFASLDPVRFPIEIMAVLFLPVTAAMAWIGAWLWKRLDDGERKGWERLLAWPMPFLVFAGLDVLFWQFASLFTLDTGVLAAGGHALILGVTAMILVSGGAVWASMAFLALSTVLRLLTFDLDAAAAGAAAAGAGFVLYLAGRLVAELAGRLPDRRSGEGPHTGLSLWSEPVSWTGMAFTAFGLLPALSGVFRQTTQAAVGLAFAGAVALAEAYRRKWYVLGYAAVAVLELAYALLMLDRDILQPQWYAIPAGLYFTGVAVFERRRGRVGFSALLESFGLIVLLLTTFGQSLNVETGFWYFLLLLVESIIVIAWSAQQQRKIPFLIGAAGSVANVIGQIVIVFLGGTTLVRWLIFGGVGLLILLAAIYAERWILPRAQDLRTRLEEWA